MFVEDVSPDPRPVTPAEPTHDTACRRPRVHPLHLGHDEAPEGRRAHARLHVGEAAPGSGLARCASRRPRLVHGRDRVGEVDLERAPRALVVRGGDRPPRGWVRRRGAVRPAAAPRGHRAVPGADRVPADGEARPDRAVRSPPPPPRRVGGRAAQPRGDQDLPGCVRPDDLRRLRPDREHAARRERPGHRGQAGLDGPADPGSRRRGDRRGRKRRATRGRRRHRSGGPSAVALQRLLGCARGDERRLPRGSGT